MSCKLTTISITLLSMFASSQAIAWQDAPSQAASPRNHAPVLASGDTSPPAAAKPTDKELIERQKTCLVSDQPLGSMGKPVKMVVKGHTVFLCCAGCKKKLLANPDKYIKKLDEKK